MIKISISFGMSRMCCLAGVGLLLSGGIQAEVTAVTVVEHGLHGGGFQSDIVISLDGNTVFTGCDVVGVHVSRD